MFDESWEILRAEAHKYMKNKEENVIKKWLDNVGYTEPVAYYRNSLDGIMEIYATRIGALMGKAGVNVKEFKKMLHDEFRGEWEIKFIEIRGGFINGVITDY